MALDILTTGPLYRGDAIQAARIAAEARSLFEAARFGDEAVGAAVTRSGVCAVVGDLLGAALQARRILDLIGARAHPTIEAMVGHERLAWASARLGDVEVAARHLGIVVGQCRDLDAPRWVAQAAAAAGELALATGRPGEAAGLMACAWHHPGMHELPRRRLVAPLVGLGLTPPPRRPAAAELEDEALLERIEALLAAPSG